MGTNAMRPTAITLPLLAVTAALLPLAAMAQTCEPTWHKAALTNYESYPAPGSEECLAYNGCQWTGQFYGIDGVQPEPWVKAHNIASVHLKDWPWLGMKRLRLRQSFRQIDVSVIDACADSDCDGCCTQNLGGDGYLIDLEKFTMQRFGSGDGIVQFQVCAAPPK